MGKTEKCRARYGKEPLTQQEYSGKRNDNDQMGVNKESWAAPGRGGGDWRGSGIDLKSGDFRVLGFECQADGHGGTEMRSKWGSERGTEVVFWKQVVGGRHGRALKTTKPSTRQCGK